MHMQALLSSVCPVLQVLTMSLRLTLHLYIQMLKAEEILATKLRTCLTAWNRDILEKLLVVQLWNPKVCKVKGEVVVPVLN
jgi:hypothetical protein